MCVHARALQETKDASSFHPSQVRKLSRDRFFVLHGKIARCQLATWLYSSFSISNINVCFLYNSLVCQLLIYFIFHFLCFNITFILIFFFYPSFTRFAIPVKRTFLPFIYIGALASTFGELHSIRETQSERVAIYLVYFRIIFTCDE